MDAATKHILLFGAGKSATVLIRYVLQQANQFNWVLTVVDGNPALVQSKLGAHDRGRAMSFNIQDAEARRSAVENTHLVISMLPPALHHIIAKDCIEFGKHLLTASYLDETIKQLEPAIRQKELFFLCEMGLDPGIDHMSALQLIGRIRREGANIHSFMSHCGGLIAPESDNNPWHYKITWNPSNVVNAGKSGAVYKKDGHIITSSYQQVFSDTATVDVPGLGSYAAYANRDARPYATLYGLDHAGTFMRTTLRHPDFCKGWQYLVQLGLTNNDEKGGANTFGDWFLQHLERYASSTSLDSFITRQVPPEDAMLVDTLFNYLGLTATEIIPAQLASSADILQYLLESRLQLGSGDKDMIVMLHEIGYEQQGNLNSIKSYMVVKGDNELETAMAKTVGLPLAIAAELLLTGKLSLKGLFLPSIPQIFEPVLNKLKENGISFNER